MISIYTHLDGFYSFYEKGTTPKELDMNCPVVGKHYCHDGFLTCSHIIRHIVCSLCLS